MKHQIEKVLIQLKIIFREIQQKHQRKFAVMKNICVPIGNRDFVYRLYTNSFCFSSNYCTGKKYLLQRHLKSHSTERPHKCIST